MEIDCPGAQFLRCAVPYRGHRLNRISLVLAHGDLPPEEREPILATLPAELRGNFRSIIWRHRHQRPAAAQDRSPHGTRRDDLCHLPPSGYRGAGGHRNRTSQHQDTAPA
jgi:hypothetical protein